LFLLMLRSFCRQRGLLGLARSLVPQTPALVRAQSTSTEDDFDDEIGIAEYIGPETLVDNSKLKTMAERMKENTDKLQVFAQSLVEMVPKWINRATINKGELVLHTSVEHVHPLIRFLRDHANCLFSNMLDITGSDHPEREKRFCIAYQFVSPNFTSRIAVKTYVDELTPIESITDLHGGADWFEREVWDMYGVYFQNHPDLRRLLTDYGFEGHPLRKDFPMTGYTEVRYDDETKRVVYEDLELAQEWRKFEVQSPWEHIPPSSAAEVAKRIKDSHVEKPPQIPDSGAKPTI